MCVVGGGFKIKSGYEIKRIYSTYFTKVKLTMIERALIFQKFPHTDGMTCLINTLQTRSKGTIGSTHTHTRTVDMMASRPYTNTKSLINISHTSKTNVHLLQPV